MMADKKLTKPTSILLRTIIRGKNEVSLSAMAFLFSEFFQYSQVRVSSIPELEKRLSDGGYQIGLRFLELICYREKNGKRETKLLGILTFISYTIWKVLFGKQADSLEKSTEQEDEYMISENQPLSITKFISTSKDYSGLNCSAFIAGIVEGILDASEFPARVTAHAVPIEGQRQPKTVILIKFNSEVISRASEL